MRIIIILIAICIGSFQKLNAQKNNQVWSHKISGNTITFNFEKELFKIDTINFYEGYVFYFKSLNDSSYFRMNYISPNAKFECCKEDSIYKEINKIFEKDIIDRKGRINPTNLYWREIKNQDVEIIYNNCSEKKLIFYNKILDSIFIKLLCNKKKCSRKKF